MIRGKRSAVLGVALAVALGGVDPSRLAASELVDTEPSLLFGSSFESGTLVDGADWRIVGNAPTISSEHARAGNYAIKSYLHRYDSESSYRTEVKALAPKPTLGQEYWYGLSIYLPASFGADTLVDTLAQWHGSQDLADKENLNPPLALRIEEGDWHLLTRWNASQPTDPEKQVETNISLGPHATNEWTDWVVRAKWSYGSDGILQVWKNGVEVVNRTGPNCFNDPQGPKFHMGVYKSAWRSQVGSVTERVVYHDEFRMAGPGASYDDVAPGRNASSKPQPPTSVDVD